MFDSMPDLLLSLHSFRSTLDEASRRLQYIGVGRDEPTAMSAIPEQEPLPGGLEPQVRSPLRRVLELLEADTPLDTLDTSILPGLLEIAEGLLSPADTDRLLDKILHRLGELVPYSSAAIHVIQGNTLHLRSGAGLAAASVGQRHTYRPQEFIWQYIERTGKPYVTPDCTGEEWYPLPGFEHTRSFMAIPLRIQGQTRAVLTVDHREPNHFGSQEVEVASLFASYAAVALHHEELAAQERNSRKLLEIQLDFSYALIQAASGRAVAEVLLDTATKVIPFDAGSVMFLHPTLPGMGRVMATRGYVDPHAAELRTINQDAYPLLRKLREELIPIYIPDVRDDERWQPGHRPDPNEVRSVLLIPLVDTSKVQQMGILTLKSYHPHAFSQESIEAVALLCNQAAQVVHNLYLFEETQRRLNETALLAEISQRLNRTFELDELLQFVLGKTLEILEMEGPAPSPLGGAIILRQRPSDQMTIAISQGIPGDAVERFNSRPYYAHEGTFQRSVLRGEWVELHTPEEVLSTYAGPAEDLTHLPQLLNIPLKAGDEVIGVLTANRVIHDVSTRRILGAMADLAGAAIHKAQLLAQARRQALELIAAHETLHEMGQRREEFIHSLTHDLRTTLTFIQGYADLMLDRALGEITPEQKEALEVMQERVETMVRLINDMLEQPAQELRPLVQEEVPLDDLARKAVRSAQMAARKAGLELALEIQGGPFVVCGDPDRLTRVFDNLLNNAIKYSPDGGVIRIHLWREGSQVNVSISDPGIGIPAQELERIWQRYYRSKDTLSEFQGTGLGLTNVRHIVEAHGGRIWVESQPNQGTTFTLQLPLK